MGSLRKTVVIVSDIHLMSEEDERGRLLLELLRQVQENSRVSHLVLLGDIFDFCFGSSVYFQNKFKKIGQALGEVQRSGCQVLFFQGNHEFSLRDLKWPGVDFIDTKDFLLATSSGTRLIFSHGDRLKAPWHYDLYLRITRSSLFRVLALLMPQRRLDKFCLELSLLSRKNGQNKRIDHKSLLALLDGWLLSSGADHAVVGHFHIPYDWASHKKPGARVLGLSSWDSPNALIFEEGEFRRLAPPFFNS